MPDRARRLARFCVCLLSSRGSGSRFSRGGLHDARVHASLAGARHQANLLLTAQLLETSGGDGDGDLEAVRNDRRGDELVLGHLAAKLVVCLLVEHHGVLQSLAGLTLAPLLRGLLRALVGGLHLGLLRLTSLRRHYCGEGGGVVR
ncbi:ribosomal protein S25 [Leishmania tarentolae]|uniref:Ribosomal protein S25 n=1 Tax=Leishmania tarentolae TaxID=5689 RepID=A0A640KRA8_LEITA|nr:ribosomal protein S25 [Leishmania tarentolae]